MHSAIKPISNGTDELDINVPITCGGVVVNPGDMIIADENGITTVPGNQLEEILKLAKEQAEREESTRKEIAKGKTVDELLE